MGSHFNNIVQNEKKCDESRVLLHLRRYGTYSIFQNKYLCIYLRLCPKFSPNSFYSVFCYSHVESRSGGFRGGRGGGSGGQGETRRCHHCDRPGHLAKNCPEKNN